jgi:signal peptidase II
VSRQVRLLALLAAGVYLLDLLTKIIVVATLSETTPAADQPKIFGGLVYFSLLRNPGAAFSMATGATWLLTIVALVVVVAIIRISRNLGSRGWALALGLLLGGALGNLGDRLFRAPSFFHGHVIDFLEFPHWPIFNLADSSIVTAAVLIALLSVRGIGIDGQRLSNTEEPVSTDEPVSDPPSSDRPASGRSAQVPE